MNNDVCPSCGLNYKDFRSGATYAEVSATVWARVQNGERGVCVPVETRRALGKIKRDLWALHLSDCRPDLDPSPLASDPEIPSWMMGTGERAREFLREELGLGPRPAVEMLAKAREAGIGRRTLAKITKREGIRVRRVSYGFTGRGQWVWELPGRVAA